MKQAFHALMLFLSLPCASAFALSYECAGEQGSASHLSVHNVLVRSFNNLQVTLTGADGSKTGFSGTDTPSPDSGAYELVEDIAGKAASLVIYTVGGQHGRCGRAGCDDLDQVQVKAALTYQGATSTFSCQ
jgi:hypothetical protein